MACHAPHNHPNDIEVVRMVPGLKRRTGPWVPVIRGQFILSESSGYQGEFLTVSLAISSWYAKARRVHVNS